MVFLFETFVIDLCVEFLQNKTYSFCKRVLFFFSSIEMHESLNGSQVKISIKIFSYTCRKRTIS